MPEHPTPAQAANLLGMVRGALAREASGVEVVVWPETPLGPLWGEVAAGRLTTLHWGQPEGYVVTQPSQPAMQVQSLLSNYFKKPSHQSGWEVFNPQGTPFQRKVWQALCEIPPGTTCTYAELAAKLASSPRAVGGAVGANPVPILIPCHRVMGQGGKLTGFSAPGGLVTKRWLLRHEGVEA